jgi:CheY-like chemotaxis protein
MIINGLELVMLIDDNSTDNFINERVIQVSGFSRQIITEDKGRSALDYLEMNKGNLSKIPELILLDLNMPVVNGFAFLDEFKKLPENVKTKSRIVVLTSSDKIEDIDAIKELPIIMDYISKPLSEKSLQNLLLKL